MAAAGYTGVWATENTRESIWDALKRKEAYSTTGPRITVRFFGGSGFRRPPDAQTRMPAEAGVCQGRADGGRPAHRTCMARRRPSRRRAEGPATAATLTASRSSRAGSTRRRGLQEKVYDVVMVGRPRTPGAGGRLPAGGQAPSMSPTRSGPTN